MPPRAITHLSVLPPLGEKAAHFAALDAFDWTLLTGQGHDAALDAFDWNGGAAVGMDRISGVVVCNFCIICISINSRPISCWLHHPCRVVER